MLAVQERSASEAVTLLAASCVGGKQLGSGPMPNCTCAKALRRVPAAGLAGLMSVDVRMYMPRLVPVGVKEDQVAVQLVPAVFSSTATTMLLVPSHRNPGLRLISIHWPATGVTVPLNTCAICPRGTQSVVLLKVDLEVLPMYTVQLFQLAKVVPPLTYLKRSLSM